MNETNVNTKNLERFEELMQETEKFFAKLPRPTKRQRRKRNPWEYGSRKGNAMFKYLRERQALEAGEDDEEASATS